MDTKDYLFTYFAIVDKAAHSIPNYDKVIFNDMSKNNQKFAAIVNKYQDTDWRKVTEKIFMELLHEGVFTGTVDDDGDIIISNVTPLTYEILDQAKQPAFWDQLAKLAPQWQDGSPTKVVVDCL